MEKRDILRKKVLELYARGIECYQTQLDNAVDIDDITDSVILNQIKSLKELRDKYPRLTRDINDDINALMMQVNPVDIKNYNKINFLIRNDIENEMIDRLAFLELLSSVDLTIKQYDVLYRFLHGFSIANDHKNLELVFKKIKKVLESDKMSDKRLFTKEELDRLFCGKKHIFASYDEYLNIGSRLPIYEQSVAESKIRMDKIRQSSLKTSILPLTLECNEVKEDE